MSRNFDIAIIGSGFAGPLLGIIARRLGRSVVLLERGRHPRFAIGESSTPLTNLLLEELAHRYALPRLLPLTKWGAWQKAYPEIACGLKRGFTFYHHTFGLPWRDSPEPPNQLLVAASPHDDIADTHWYRPDFDHFLVREAQTQDVEYLDQAQLATPERTARGFLLRGKRAGKPICLAARFLVDATGGSGFLQQCFRTPAKAFRNLPATQALYTHFSGVRRWENVCPDSQTPPYPVDDAALHHVFDGGWIWVLRFNNGITSAGVAATAQLGNELRLAEGAPAWERLLNQLPTVREQFAAAKSQAPFVHIPQLSFRRPAAAGLGWAMLPSAAGFVDPLLSTGFPLTLLGISRLAQLIERDWSPSGLHFPAVRAYSQQTLQELDAAALMVGALYANMNDFTLFTPLALLYFAAATFTETARRLGRPDLAGPAFLLSRHPLFGPQARACFLRALARREPKQTRNLVARIYETIEPVDVAGLSRHTRRDWFPVKAVDLLAAAPKVNATRQEIRQLLARCGFNGNQGKGGPANLSKSNPE